MQGFACGLEFALHLVVTLQNLAHLGNLFRTETQLAGLSAGVTHIKNPEGMTLTARTFGTTAGVMNGALEERAAQYLAQDCRRLSTCFHRSEFIGGPAHQFAIEPRLGRAPITHHGDRRHF